VPGRCSTSGKDEAEETHPQERGLAVYFELGYRRGPERDRQLDSGSRRGEFNKKDAERTIPGFLVQWERERKDEERRVSQAHSDGQTCDVYQPVWRGIGREEKKNGIGVVGAILGYLSIINEAEDGFEKASFRS